MPSAKHLNSLKNKSKRYNSWITGTFVQKNAIIIFLNIILCYGIPWREKSARKRNVARDLESMFLDVEKFGFAHSFLSHVLHWRSPPLYICLCPLPHFIRLWPAVFHRSDVAQGQSACLASMRLWVQLPLWSRWFSVKWRENWGNVWLQSASHRQFAYESGLSIKK